MSPSALRRQIGQLLIAGFNGHTIPPELRSLATEFGLGGVISNFGLVLDLIGFLLLLIFVLASSVIGLVRAPRVAATTA